MLEHGYILTEKQSICNAPPLTKNNIMVIYMQGQPIVSLLKAHLQYGPIMCRSGFSRDILKDHNSKII